MLESLSLSFGVSVLKKRLQRKCFSVNIAKFFRTPPLAAFVTYHFTNKGKARGYNQLVRLIKIHLSLTALRPIIIFPRFLNPT